jgi:hypothetical protein
MLIIYCQNLPQARKSSAFRTVWRHCAYSWDTIQEMANVYDTELNDQFRNTALGNIPCAILLAPSLSEHPHHRWRGRCYKGVELSYQYYDLSLLQHAL